MKTLSAQAVKGSFFYALTTAYSIVRWSPLSFLPIGIRTDGWGQGFRITFGRLFQVLIDAVVPLLDFGQLEIDALIAGESHAT